MVLREQARMIENRYKWASGLIQIMNNQRDLNDLNDLVNRRIRHCRIGKITRKREPREIRLPDAYPTKPTA